MPHVHPNTLIVLDQMEAENPPPPWNHQVNRHPTAAVGPWGAIEYKAHPAGGAGERMTTWEGEKARKAAALLVRYRNEGPKMAAEIRRLRALCVAAGLDPDDDAEPQEVAQASAQARTAWEFFKADREGYCDEIVEERMRQERLRQDGKFPFTAATPAWPNDRRLSIVTEELGAVAEALNDWYMGKAIWTAARAELVQVAACAMAFVEALDAEAAVMTDPLVPMPAWEVAALLELGSELTDEQVAAELAGVLHA